MSEVTTHPKLPARYEPQAEIGRGGMGVVWRVIDRQFERPLAMKLTLPEIAHHPDAAARFEREATLTGKLQHPAIPAIVDRGTLEDGTPYFSMKLIEGQTLAEMLNQRQSTDEDLARYLSVFEQVCQGVGYAHSQGVLHRDLKPANIMVGTFGEVQVMDWGMAKRIDDAVDSFSPPAHASTDQDFDPEALTAPLDLQCDDERTGETDDLGEHETLTRGGQILGTLAYMPPEQAQGDNQKIQAQADVFALGGVLCKILTGRAPYQGTDRLELAQRVLAADLKPAYEALDACSADRELVELCQNCLSADVHQRPADASDVAAAVRAYQESTRKRLEQARTERAAAVARSEEAKKRQRVTLVAAGLAIVLIVSAALVAGWRQSEENARLAREAQESFERQQREQQATSDIEVALRDAPGLTEVFQFDAAKALLKQAATRLSAIEEPSELAAQIEQAQRDVELISELDRIRLHASELIGTEFISTHYGHGRNGHYATAFRNYGLDIPAGDPSELAAAIRQSQITSEIVMGLHAWRFNENDRPLFESITQVIRETDAAQLDGSLVASLIESDVEDLTNLSELNKLQAIEFQMLIHDLKYDGHAAKVIPVYRIALSRHPGDFWLNYNFAARNEERPELGLAERIGYARVAAAVRPGSVAANNNVGIFLFQAEQFQAALVALQRSVALAPEYGPTRVNLGIVLGRMGRFEEGERELRAAIESDPDDASFHLALGNLFEEQKRMAEAEQAYRRAIECDDRLPKVHNNLALLLTELERFDEAEEAYHEAIRVQPESAVVYANLGAFLQGRQRLDEAAQAYESAIELDPEDADSHFNLGTLRHAQERYGDAEKAYLKAIELRHDFEAAIHNLARMNFQQQKWQAASLQLQTQISLHPADVTSYGLLGVCLINLDRPQDALEVMELGKARCPVGDPQVTVFNNHIARLRKLLNEAGTPKPQ